MLVLFIYIQSESVNVSAGAGCVCNNYGNLYNRISAGRAKTLKIGTCFSLANRLA